MIRGLYLSASGMRAKQTDLNIISNNLANVNTAGFKKDGTVQGSFEETLISRLEKGKRPAALGPLGRGAYIEENYTDFTQGGLMNTENPLDFAIDGEGFFEIQTPEGIMYTRNGNFTVNDEGQVVTQQGYQVLGERGPLQTIRGREINVNSNGELYLGDVAGDRIRIVDFEDRSNLVKVGDNLYTTPEEAVELDGEYQIRQGYLEQSNINVVEEMVKMIEANRVYQTNQQVISAADSTLEKAVQAGALR